jgi:phosphohistidine swiveling domain-containing protein
MVAVAPIALTDPAARDPSVAGVKAARLAAAADAGLPVLPGRILPMEASAVAIAAGADALERSGRPAACLSAMESPLPAGTQGGLIPPVAAGPALFVARSTTDRDGDGRWSGAFTSYLGIEAGDLPTAVRGCWASAFSGDALGRCRETGADVRTLRVGVLVQPFLRLDAGGTARVRRDGAVDVSAARGGAVGVVAGRRGGRDVTVGTDGRIVGEPGLVAAATVTAAAALARRAARAVAAATIEWGAVGDQVSLLQIGPTSPGEVAAPAPSRPAPLAPVPAGAERLARLVTTFAGPLADELVLPWALGAGEVSDWFAVGSDEAAPATDATSVDGSASALLEARALAGELAAGVWGTSPTVARECASAVSRLLLKGRVEDGIRAIALLPPPDPAAARRVVAIVRGAGELLVGAGLLPSAVLVWRLTGPELDRAIAGDRPALRNGPGRWEPFVADVLRSRGRVSQATPVSPGVGAGRLRVVPELRTIGRPGPREILVTPLPLPHLAPLLWHSAALVTAAGTSGAHLFEVARSLGVPAVAGADLDALGEADSLVAVDGDTGLVSVLPSLEASGAGVPAPGEPRPRAMV